MKIKSFTSPDEVTGQLRQLSIYRRQRYERGFDNTSTKDLNTEAGILIRLLALERKAALDRLGEVVGRSHERR